MLASDTVFAAITTAKAEALKQSLIDCSRDVFCFMDKLKFSEEEIRKIGERLQILYRPGNALDKLVTLHLAPSGCYVLFQQADAKEWLRKAWEQDARGVNFTIGVYAEGKKPNYPNIDSISFKVHDPRSFYAGFVYNTVSVLGLENKQEPSFFSIPLLTALRFIEMNEREQAADYEPMNKGENKAAYDKIKTTQWAKYPYSVIVVPGAGPEDPRVALSAEAMLRCRLAAVQYHKGLAPFIITSGGKVHPYKTVFCEAAEMKKFLTEKLNIPESAIIIDPHARHTTTNMRNAARLIFRYGMPFNKPGISCTTRGQSNMITATLIDRCLRELKEMPFRNGRRLSETEVEFYPLAEALHINPTEPIDP